MAGGDHFQQSRCHRWSEGGQSMARCSCRRWSGGTMYSAVDGPGGPILGGDKLLYDRSTPLMCAGSDRQRKSCFAQSAECLGGFSP